ncbi:hypothetical protein [Candidatus Ichthyocystis sparus]|uniref:hypothetical protein n=1 Tax=Candidatus Ichthyocystis sparus TaxID=1561004 RepID=UPI000B89E1EA|nr:hypothetical protein [Candidatus Ichthyocystis sparus]
MNVGDTCPDLDLLDNDLDWPTVGNRGEENEQSITTALMQEQREENYIPSYSPINEYRSTIDESELSTELLTLGDDNFYLSPQLQQKYVPSTSSECVPGTSSEMNTQPVNTLPISVSKQEQPIGGKTQFIGNQMKTLDGQIRLTGNSLLLIGNTIRPISNPMQLVGNPILPISNQIVLIGNTIRPIGNPMQPTVNPMQPTVNPMQPTVNPIQPAVNPIQPAVNPIQPTVSPIQPAVNPIQPAVPSTSKESRSQLKKTPLPMSANSKHSHRFTMIKTATHSFSKYRGLKIDNETGNALANFVESLSNELDEDIRSSVLGIRKTYLTYLANRVSWDTITLSIRFAADDIALKHALRFSQNYAPKIKSSLSSAKIFDNNRYRNISVAETKLVFCTLRRDTVIKSIRDLEARIMSLLPEYRAERPVDSSAQHKAYSTNLVDDADNSKLHLNIPEEYNLVSEDTLKKTCLLFAVNENLESMKNSTLPSDVLKLVKNVDFLDNVASCIKDLLIRDICKINLCINSSAFTKLESIDYAFIELDMLNKSSNLDYDNPIWGKIFTADVRKKLEEIVSNSILNTIPESNNKILENMVNFFRDLKSKSPEFNVSEKIVSCMMDNVKKGRILLKDFFCTTLRKELVLSRRYHHKISQMQVSIKEKYKISPEIAILLEMISKLCSSGSTECEVRSKVDSNLIKFINVSRSLLEPECKSIQLLLKKSPVIVNGTVSHISDSYCSEITNQIMLDIIHTEWSHAKNKLYKDCIKRANIKK